MKNISKTFAALGAVAAAVAVVGCAGMAGVGTPSSAELDKVTQEMVKAAFRDQGIAKVSRV